MVRRVWGVRGLKVVQRLQLRYEWKYLFLVVDFVRGKLEWAWMDSMKSETVVRAVLGMRRYTQVVTTEIVTLILEQPVGTPWLAAFCLAFYSGVRRSELCGLRWHHVDLEEYCLTIDRARVAVKGGSVEGEPKSETGRRLVSLSTNIVYVLYYHLKDQQRMFEALGIPWTEECYLFCNDQGKPYNPSSVTHAFKRMARKAGFPNVRLHDSRHGHATITDGRRRSSRRLYKRDSDIVQLATTMDIYSHVLREMDVSAAEAFDRQFDDVGAQIGAQKRKSDLR